MISLAIVIEDLEQNQQQQTKQKLISLTNNTATGIITNTDRNARLFLYFRDFTADNIQCVQEKGCLGGLRKQSR